MNQIFGYQNLTSDTSINKFQFEGTNPLFQDTSSFTETPQLQVFSQHNSSLYSCYSNKHKVYAYVWGIPVHPRIPVADIADWCANITVEQSYVHFRELVGPFVVIIDDPARNRVTFITDVLGVRPMYVGIHDHRMVFGSKVWPLYKAGLNRGVIDYDAVSSWIAYGCNYTPGSLFKGLLRLPPGTATIFENSRFTDITYTEFHPKSKNYTKDDVAETLHNIISSSSETLLEQYNRFSISLSGGFDSRYLLALAASHKNVSFDCVTVDYIPEETQIASEVAKTLGVPLHKYTMKGSIWDKYDHVYHTTSDGFPISRNVNYCVVQEYPQVPIINGYVGGTLKGFGEKVGGKYETEWDGDLADILQMRHMQANLNVLRNDIALRIKERSRVPMETAVMTGAKIGKVFNWANVFYRQRLYIANNFLQHLDITEAVMPYYSWEFLTCMMEYDSRLFTWDLYDIMFKRFFPNLAKIPHSRELISHKKKIIGTAKCTKRWSRELLSIITNNEYLNLLENRLSIIHSLAGMVGLRKAETTIFFLKRLYLLETSLKDNNLDFNWDNI